MKRPWVTLFSQTGSEIYNISKQIGRSPDVIITNRLKENILEIKSELVEEYGDKIVFVRKAPFVVDYLQNIPTNSLVTLHGWLRIIPEKVCEQYEIYNLHPAPIHLEGYEKYKGKDPQVRIFEDKAKYSGNVIHKCIPELDAGEIMSRGSFDVTGFDLDMIFKLTHSQATKMWVDFLKDRL
jgi:folate-dependent phosphoribosylglycinamide formyltransferase PurN